MKTIIRKFFFLIAFIIISTTVFAQGYEITIKVKGVENQSLILGHHFNESLFPDDTAQVNSKGVAVFRGKEKLPGGMYLVFLPSAKYFDILVDENQKFTIENDTADLIKHAKSVNSKENKLFFEYQRYLQEKNKQAKALREELKTTKDEKRKKELKDELSEINKEVKAKLNELTNEHPETFFATFLKATQEVEVPEHIESDDDKYIYYRKHFFDNFDVSDARLLRTPIYDRKITTYISKVVPQVPDTLIEEVDWLIKQSRTSDELFRYMLITLHNHFASSQIMGMDAVFVHIAENYYIPEAHWSSPDYINKLKSQIAKKKYTLIGTKAANLKMRHLPRNKNEIESLIDLWAQTKQAGQEPYERFRDKLAPIKKIQDDARRRQDSMAVGQNYIIEINPYIQRFQRNLKDSVSIYGLDKEHIVVWFWEPDCSHCRKASPQLRDMYEKIKHLGVEVFAVFLQNHPAKWKEYTHATNYWLEFIRDNKLYSWVNVWDPFGQTDFRRKYDIYSSPVSYLLNKDKEIVAKRIPVSAIENLIFDDIISDIVDKNQGKARIKKFEALITDDKFTLREMEAIRMASKHYLDDDEEEKVLKLIEKQEQLIQKNLEEKIKSIKKDNQPDNYVQVMRDYVDTVLNENDLEYVKEVTDDLFDENQASKIKKHISTRIKRME